MALHPADAELIPARYGIDIESLLGRMRALLTDCGVPIETLEQLTGASMGVREFVELAQPDVLLKAGSPIPLAGWDLIAIHIPGNSPGHVCFYERSQRILLSGDHVLPRISPNVSVHVQQSGNPLAEFLDALRRVRLLDIDEVLPAHEWRFRGLATRIDELVAHHHERLAEAEAVCERRPASRAGRRRCSCTGRAPGRRSPDSCNEQRWAKRWRTSCCSRAKGGRAGREGSRCAGIPLRSASDFLLLR